MLFRAMAEATRPQDRFWRKADNEQSYSSIIFAFSAITRSRGQRERAVVHVDRPDQRRQLQSLDLLKDRREDNAAIERAGQSLTSRGMSWQRVIICPEDILHPLPARGDQRPQVPA